VSRGAGICSIVPVVLALGTPGGQPPAKPYAPPIVSTAVQNK
jgi:hypothetical protein